MHARVHVSVHVHARAKTIQAMGRIGRNNIQQEYTLRFRDDVVAYTLPVW
jgi:hypothetical protein